MLQNKSLLISISFVGRQCLKWFSYWITPYKRNSAADIRPARHGNETGEEKLGLIVKGSGVGLGEVGGVICLVTMSKISPLPRLRSPPHAGLATLTSPYWLAKTKALLWTLLAWRLLRVGFSCSSCNMAVQWLQRHKGHYFY